jgi:tetratricopeptide (TPR) repeat protein
VQARCTTGWLSEGRRRSWFAGESSETTVSRRHRAPHSVHNSNLICDVHVLTYADPKTLTNINSVATLLKRQGRLPEAEALFREAVAGWRRLYGSEHENTLSALNNLGTVLQGLGSLAEAQTLYLEALAGSRRTLGPDHEDTLNTMTNLATVLKGLGGKSRLAEAETLMRESLAARRKALGNDHTDTLSCINHLAGKQHGCLT